MANFHVIANADGATSYPDVRRIEIGDLYDCLLAGWQDFMAKPSHIIFIVIMYPLIGVVLAAWTSGANALPMLFPLASGFALLGPFAAIGLYEISRRREMGLDASWRHVLALRSSPALPSPSAPAARPRLPHACWGVGTEAGRVDVCRQSRRLLAASARRCYERSWSPPKSPCAHR